MLQFVAASGSRILNSIFHKTQQKYYFKLKTRYVRQLFKKIQKIKWFH